MLASTETQLTRAGFELEDRTFGNTGPPLYQLSYNSLSVDVSSVGGSWTFLFMFPFRCFTRTSSSMSSKNFPLYIVRSRTSPSLAVLHIDIRELTNRRLFSRRRLLWTRRSGAKLRRLEIWSVAKNSKTPVSAKAFKLYRRFFGLHIVSLI